MSGLPVRTKAVGTLNFAVLVHRTMPIDPKVLHKYLYANGDSVNGIDPRGRTDLVEYSAIAVQKLENVAAEALEPFGIEFCEVFDEVLTCKLFDLVFEGITDVKLP